ncbi:putative mfs transporter [Diaporthe ampelina]|uniref:Putative mfs transporter n=1 Tax=Diaporthe ampelina TaxID=1214573 RepID=A0A0G2H803_9PEZI|nr:putative mfs transporter [Diaporthe ampelina]
MSALSFSILPDKPLRTKWLTPAERRLAHDRIAGDTIELKEKGTLVQGLRYALRDRRVWIFLAIEHVNAFTGSIWLFLPTLLTTLEPSFSQFTTLVMTCPPYLVACVSAMGVSI